jgi:CTD small phosphatase-like protein 2
LKKTIIVDNMPSNFQLQPDNGIFIKSWVGDVSDSVLLEMAENLRSKD